MVGESAALKRVLQQAEVVAPFERLGGTKTIPIDVPLVAATNRNLTQMMGDKLFRSDLYYRLKVFPIETMTALVSWRRPGNIRELENFIERAVILSSGS